MTAQEDPERSPTARSVLPLVGPWTDEKEMDHAWILDGINGVLSMKCYGSGRPDVQPQLCHYGDDDSLEFPTPEMAFILVTHEWFSVKISLFVSNLGWGIKPNE